MEQTESVVSWSGRLYIPHDKCIRADEDAAIDIYRNGVIHEKIYPVWICEFSFYFKTAKELNELEVEWNNGMTYRGRFYGAEEWRSEYRCGVWIAHFKGRHVR